MRWGSGSGCLASGTPQVRPCRLETRPSRPGTPSSQTTGAAWRRCAFAVLLGVVVGLAACERQADRVFDRNPDYAGKADVHENYPDAATWRRRVLMVQTDR